MIKILQRNIQCDRCKTNLSYEPIDILYKTRKIYGYNFNGDSVVGEERINYIICPICKNQISI